MGKFLEYTRVFPMINIISSQAPGTYDPKMIDTSRKVTIRQKLNDFKPDQNPGKCQNIASPSTVDFST